MLTAATLAPARGAELPMSEVAPGIFVHIGVIELMSRDNQGAIANVGFVIGNDAVAVIDSGGSVAEGEALLAAIRLRTNKPIRYVINTHGHPDHIFGNAAFLKEGATFVGHAILPRALLLRGPHYLSSFIPSMGRELLEPVKIVPPTTVVSESMTLDLGGRPLLLRAWPTAHSDNDLTVLDPVSGTLFAGDLVFVNHIPVVDGSIRGWLTAIAELATIKAKLVVPGHGPLSEWPAALKAERRYLSSLLADLRTFNAQGKTIDVAARDAAATERGRWKLFDDYNARNATTAFSEIEWE
ncbi:MAG: quinoprotein relay system zinc metallohydrolase 2 [Alphaproteobacteria bacterium]|nr:quinoprotein relay system zinc metallohydrolase 2 [Alphaproteobacteria bacterium]